MNQHRAYTEEELALVREHHNDRKKLWSLLPHRTKKSIAVRIFKLDLAGKAYKPWTVREEQILRDNRGNTRKQLKLLPGRTKMSIKSKAAKLGLTTRNNRPWSGEEIARLRAEWYPGIPFSRARAKWPGRSLDAIRAQAKRLGLHLSQQTHFPDRAA